MRTLRQPGAPLQPRRLLVWGEGAEQLRLVAPAGADLLTWLAAGLERRGARSAGLALTGGSFARMQYLTGQPDASGARVATYGPPTTVERAVLVSGSATFGRGPDGGPLVHCHAVVVGPDGRVHGGHLPPGASIAGQDGVVAWAVAIDGAEWRVAYDPETNYPIFQPCQTLP
jgi:hypothetical protein